MTCVVEYSEQKQKREPTTATSAAERQQDSKRDLHVLTRRRYFQSAPTSMIKYFDFEMAMYIYVYDGVGCSVASGR